MLYINYFMNRLMDLNTEHCEKMRQKKMYLYFMALIEDD